MGERSIIELAAEEGHDADIPSNEGFVRTISRQAPVGTLTEHDIEKHAGSLTSASSIHSAGKNEKQIIEEESDSSNIVDWDGDDDPKNPFNWGNGRKWFAITIVSAITFLTPLASSIFAPGVLDVMKEFNSHSNLLEGFVVSVYVLGFAFGPLGKFQNLPRCYSSF